MTEQRERWLTLRQVKDLLTAAEMEVSEQTIRNWGEARKLDMRKTAGGHRRFAATSVQKVIAAWQSNGDASPPPESS